MAARTEKYSALRSNNPEVVPWLWWIFASLLGGVLIGVFSRPEDFLMHLVLRGFIIGAAQWLVLRHYFGERLGRATLWWIPTTGAGMVLSTLALLLPPIHGALSNFYTALYQQFGLWEVFWINLLQEGLLWGLVGVLQWLVLRRWIGAGLWIGLSILGGALMGMTAAATCYVACGAQIGPWNTGVILPDAAAWGVFGTVTGYGLWRAMRHANG